MCLKLVPDICIKSREKHLNILSSKLIELGNYGKAAKVYYKFLKSQEALKILVQGHEWIKAYKLLFKLPKEQFTFFTQTIYSRFENIFKQIEILTQNIISKKNRLLKVRDEKLLSQANCFDNLMSDSSSETSSMSGSSYSGSINTSKSRRKKTRKRQISKYYRTKIGGKYEDFALLHELYIIFLGFQKDEVEIIQFLKVLLMMNEWKMAEELIEKTNIFKRFLRESSTQIWTPVLHLGPINTCVPDVPFTSDQSSLENLPIIEIPTLNYDEIQINLFKKFI
uniref:Elongator complex protein 1 (Trinotate prediction) n=1 Tax=Henneguya salminicola TaxID=69463 RepID=A0A6G3MFG3_HENSL